MELREVVKKIKVRVNSTIRDLECVRCHKTLTTNISGNLIDEHRRPCYQCPVCGQVNAVAEAYERAKKNKTLVA